MLCFIISNALPVAVYEVLRKFVDVLLMGTSAQSLILNVFAWLFLHRIMCRSGIGKSTYIAA